MPIFSCWDGMSHVVFSDHASAAAHAEQCRADWREMGHPMADCPVWQLVEPGPPRYWVRPAHVREDGAFIGAAEAPPVEAGDDSPEVAAVVAAWHADREAALAAG